MRQYGVMRPTYMRGVMATTVMPIYDMFDSYVCAGVVKWKYNSRNGAWSGYTKEGKCIYVGTYRPSQFLSTWHHIHAGKTAMLYARMEPYGA